MQASAEQAATVEKAALVARAALAVQPVRQEQQALAALVAKVAWAEPAESVAHN